MKKSPVLRSIALLGILAFMPFYLHGKEDSKSDDVIKDCTLPDGTVADLNLFKTESNFQNDKAANLSDIGCYKLCRPLTKEELLAWQESKKPVEEEEYFLRQYSLSETNLLETMKKRKMRFASSYTTEGGTKRVIYILADKTYKSLTYERFLMTERAEDELSGYTVSDVVLPDKTVTDLIMFTTRDDYMEFVKEWLSSGGIGSSWMSESYPSAKQLKKILNHEGSISSPGYMVRHYSMEKLGEIGTLMKEKQFIRAAFVKDTGDRKRQLIELVVCDTSWDVFRYQKTNYVLQKIFGEAHK